MGLSATTYITSGSAPSLKNWWGSLGRKRQASPGSTRSGWSIFVAHAAVAGDHVIELPLRAVRMIGVRRLTGRDAQDFDVERMPLEQVGRIALAPERLGDLNAFAAKGSLRGCPFSGSSSMVLFRLATCYRCLLLKAMNGNRFGDAPVVEAPDLLCQNVNAAGFVLQRAFDDEDCEVRIGRRNGS